jgi:hypothetical protein
MNEPQGTVVSPELEGEYNFSFYSQAELKDGTASPIHSVCIDKFEHKMIMADSTFLYLLNEKATPKDAIVRLQDHNIIGFSTVEHKYLYCVKRSHGTQDGGLFLYELSKCLDSSPKQENYRLTNSQVSMLGQVDYSVHNERLAYLKDLRQIEILPLPHRNSIKLNSFPRRSDILATKRTNDSFTVFTSAGHLMTWDLAEGKLIKTHDTGKRLDEWTLFRRQHSHNSYTSHFYDN